MSVSKSGRELTLSAPKVADDAQEEEKQEGGPGEEPKIICGGETSLNMRGQSWPNLDGRPPCRN